MDSCTRYLILCSIFWSFTPFLYKKAGNFYDIKDSKNAAIYGSLGFVLSCFGTILFIKSTSLCNNLSKIVTYTYALPIIFTTATGVLIFNQNISMLKIFALFLIIVGLYLL